MLMISRPQRLSSRRFIQILIGTLFLLTTTFGSSYTTPQAALAATTDVGYRDFSFGTSVSSPTAEKPQSKLWFNDGIWWGNLYSQSAGEYRIYRLDWATQTWSDTGTRIDEREVARTDALWDGTHLYVASAGTSSTNSAHSARIMRYSYNSTTKAYSLDSGFPVTIVTGGMEAVVIDKDSTGKLWATYTRGTGVYVTHSTTDDRTWVTPYVIPVSGASNLVSGTDGDMSAIIAFDTATAEPKIGVMWSNQNDDAMYFAMHTDGKPDSEWVVEPAVQAPEYADDHLNLKSLQTDASGRVFAATKTSLNASDAPLVLLLVKGTSGGWSRHTFGRVADDHTRPIVLIDQQNRNLYVFASSPCCSGGIVYYKQTPLDKISFPTGKGTPFIQSSTDTKINNVTSTKQTLNSATGLVVAASDNSSDYYLHNSIQFSSEPDTTIASGPADPTNSTSASFSFSSSEPDSTFQCQLDGAAYEACASPKEYTGLAEGPHVFSVRAIDTEANTDSTPATYDWSIDTTAPTVSSTVPTDAETEIAASANVEAVFSEEMDATSIGTASFTLIKQGTTTSIEATVSYDSSTKKAQLNPSADLEPLATYIATIKGGTSGVADLAGNVLASDKTWSFTTSNATTVSFAADADAYVDESLPDTNYGVATTLSADTSPNQQSYMRFAVSGLSGSVQSAKLRLYSSGNTTDGPAVYAAASNDWTETGITWNLAPGATGTATDDKGAISSGVWVEYDVTPLVTIDGSYSFVLVGTSSDGADFHAREASSNHPELVVTYSSSSGGDTTPADTTIDSGPSGTVNASSASFTFSSNETDSSFECSLDGAVFAACATPKEYTSLPDGDHTFRVRAIDVAGNTDPTPAERSWTVDTTAPTVSSVAPVDGATGVGISTSVESVFSEAMDANTITTANFILVEQETGTSVSATVSYDSETKKALLDPSSSLQSGTSYTATVVGDSSGVKDLAGNALASNKVWSFTTAQPDTTAPAAILTDPSDGATVGGNVTLAADATDDIAIDHVEFLVNNAVVGSDTSSPYSISWDSTAVVDGPAVIAARAVDTSDNTTTSTSHSVIVDNTPADTTIDSGPSGTVNASSASFTFSSNETDSSFECSLDGAVFAACATPKEYTSLPDGDHTFRVRAIDVAGNTDPTPAERSWTVDTTAPTVSSVAPVDGATGVALAANLEAVFSESMDPSSIGSTTFTLAEQGSTTTVSGTVSYDSETMKAILDPSSDLEGGVSYTATIKGGVEGVKDLVGHPLAADKVWSFTTDDPDVTAPEVTTVAPADGATEVAMTAKVEASFSEAMDATTITTSTFTLLRQGTTTEVAAAVSYDSAAGKAILTPSSSLAEGATYTATVKGGNSGVKDLAGNPLAMDKAWAFTIEAVAAPSNLTATRSGSPTKQKIDLSWTDNSKVEAKFAIERSTSSDFKTNLVTYEVSANTTSYRDTALQSTTKYYYRVFAVTSTGARSISSNVASVTTK